MGLFGAADIEKLLSLNKNCHTTSIGLRVEFLLLILRLCLNRFRRLRAYRTSWGRKHRIHSIEVGRFRINAVIHRVALRWTRAGNVISKHYGLLFQSSLDDMSYGIFGAHLPCQFNGGRIPR